MAPPVPTLHQISAADRLIANSGSGPFGTPDSTVFSDFAGCPMNNVSGACVKKAAICVQGEVSVADRIAVYLNKYRTRPANSAA